MKKEGRKEQAKEQLRTEGNVIHLYTSGFLVPGECKDTVPPLIPIVNATY